MDHISRLKCKPWTLHTINGRLTRDLMVRERTAPSYETSNIYHFFMYLKTYVFVPVVEDPDQYHYSLNRR